MSTHRKPIATHSDLNLSTSTALATVAAAWASARGAMPYMLARRLAAAKMNSACRGSDGLNSMGVGGFFAPDLWGGFG